MKKCDKGPSELPRTECDVLRCSLFCLNKSQKPNDIQFAMIENRDKQQIFTFGK